MHVDRGNLTVKLWLDPDVRVADNHGYSRRELREIERLAREHVEQLRDEWDRFCTSTDSAT
jgi:hypothetical protein